MCKDEDPRVQDAEQQLAANHNVQNGMVCDGTDELCVGGEIVIFECVWTICTCDRIRADTSMLFSTIDAMRSPLGIDLHMGIRNTSMWIFQDRDQQNCYAVVTKICLIPETKESHVTSFRACALMCVRINVPAAFSVDG